MLYTTRCPNPRENTFKDGQMQALGFVAMAVLILFVGFMLYDVTTNPDGHGNTVVSEEPVRFGE